MIPFYFYYDHTFLMQANDYYCEEYPVLNYTLVITSGTDKEIALSVVAEDSITVDRLLENAVYIFQIIANNAVGTISTNNRTICKPLTCNNLIYYFICVTDTTDVQMVRAVVLSDVTFRVQCDFIPGSDAQGCMIVLVGDYNNVSVTLLMNLTNTEIINVTTSVSCYKRVIAFDIEYDGQVGTLAVPGKLSGNVNTSPKCLPSSKPSSKGILTY